MDPDKAVEIIWNNAHKDNKEVAGPIKDLNAYFCSYNAIVDLTDYSYEVIQEDGEMVHYEIKNLNNKMSILLLLGCLLMMNVKLVKACVGKQ